MLKNLKLLAKSIRQYKFVSAITPIFMIIEVVMEAFIVLVSGHLVNKINPVLNIVYMNDNEIREVVAYSDSEGYVSEGIETVYIRDGVYAIKVADLYNRISVGGTDIDMNNLVQSSLVNNSFELTDEELAIYQINEIKLKDSDLISVILKYSITLICMALISFAGGVGGGIYGAKASAGFAANLREDIFSKIQDFSFENVDSFQTSSLVTRLTTDIGMIQMSFQMLIRIAIRVPLQMISAVILAFSIDKELPWLFVFIIPVLGLGLFAIAKVVMPIFTRLFKKYDDMNNSVQENVKGIRVVKSYVREEYEIEKFNNVSRGLVKEFTFAERILAFNNPLMQLCIHIAIILISYFGAVAVCTRVSLFGGVSTLEMGNFQSLITYGVQMLGGLMMLSMIFVMMSMSLECINRVCEVLCTKSNLVSPKNPVTEVKNGEIVFDNVNFKYSLEAQKYALFDIDIHIPSGSTVGIIGGTGSSKTTLVNLISRLYDVTDGSISVGGVNVKDYDLKVLRDSVAVVLQKNVLFSGTVLENLRWGKEDATLEEARHVCQISQADEFIMAHPEGYDRFIEQGGTNVSGGQKQRICIARALLKSPKVLILDDSTSAVDTRTDALIRKRLKDTLPDVTKIIIAQRVSSIQDSDIIIVMDNGTINGIGNHDELIKSNAIYQEVYHTQNRVGGDE